MGPDVAPRDSERQGDRGEVRTDSRARSPAAHRGGPGGSPGSSVSRIPGLRRRLGGPQSRPDDTARSQGVRPKDDLIRGETSGVSGKLEPKERKKIKRNRAKPGTATGPSNSAPWRAPQRRGNGGSHRCEFTAGSRRGYSPSPTRGSDSCPPPEATRPDKGGLPGHQQEPEDHPLGADRRRRRRRGGRMPRQPRGRPSRRTRRS